MEIGKLKPLIPKAIQNAKIKDTPRSIDWPRNNGSTIYRLIEKLIHI